MIFAFIMELLIGIVCIVPGVLLWEKQILSILHEHQYKNVKQADIPAYTKQMGIGLIVIGIGIIMTGLLNLFYSTFWWIPLLAGFIVGLTTMCLAQKKYNKL